MAKTPVIPVVAYVRYSPRPKSSEVKLASQFGDIRRYCSTRNMKIVAVFRDRLRSGAEVERENLWEAIAAVPQKGRLIARSIDRIARDTVLLCTIETTLKKKRASIETADGTGNGDSPDAQLIRGIMAQIAQHQRRISAMRTKNAMLRYQAQNRAMSAEPPYGLSRVGKRLVINKDEQAVISSILAYHKSGLGIKRIVNKLNEPGGPPPRGKIWWLRSVQRIIARARAEQAA